MNLNFNIKHKTFSITGISSHKDLEFAYKTMERFISLLEKNGLKEKDRDIAHLRTIDELLREIGVIGIDEEYKNKGKEEDSQNMEG